MSGSVFVKGGEHAISGGRVCIGGGYRRITRGVGCVDGTNWASIANFVPPLSATISPGEADGFTNPFKPLPQKVTTSALSATPTGGKSPFSYSWSITEYEGSTTPTLNSPTSAITTASMVVPANTELAATAKVIVTDALGSVADATAQLVFINQSGGAG